MLDLLSKTARYIRREYPKTAAITGPTMGVAAVFSFGMPMGTPFFLLIGSALSFAFLQEFDGEGRPGKNNATVNGTTFIGARGDVASIHMMQRLVTSLTKDLKHLDELPPQVHDKIARHFDDIRPALARVRMYNPKGDTVKSFSFSRDVIGFRGKPYVQPVASVTTPFEAAIRAMEAMEAAQKPRKAKIAKAFRAKASPVKNPPVAAAPLKQHPPRRPKR